MSLELWPKLTGGKGLHLMAPLDRTIDHDEARAYARQIAQRLAVTASTRYTISSAPGKRAGRIIHRLFEERPWHDGHWCLVTAGAGGIPEAML